MSENDNDTGNSTGGTPDDAAAKAAASKGSNDGKDPVSLLTSRLNGQTAKVGELTGTLTAKEEALQAALKRVAELEAGTVSADEAAKAQVAKANAALEQERKERRVSDLKTRFPESFGELGDDIAAVMDETKLAAIEARLTGEDGANLPTPQRHNETKDGTPRQAAKEKSADDLKAELLASPMPW